MGGGKSKEQSLENQGQVNTNVVIEDDVQFQNKDMLTLLYLIAGILIAQLLLKIHRMIHKNARKNALRDNAANNNV